MSEDVKRRREKRLLQSMVGIYCRKQHGRRELCDDCAELLAYCARRSDICPRMAEKSFCLHCPSPCYHPVMRQRIREVMRFSGPRMLLYHPLAAVHHGLETIKQKSR